MNARLHCRRHEVVDAIISSGDERYGAARCWRVERASDGTTLTETKAALFKYCGHGAWCRVRSGRAQHGCLTPGEFERISDLESYAELPPMCEPTKPPAPEYNPEAPFEALKAAEAQCTQEGSAYPGAVRWGLEERNGIPVIERGVRYPIQGTQEFRFTCIIIWKASSTGSEETYTKQIIEVR
jgi:hypothetical protein